MPIRMEQDDPRQGGSGGGNRSKPGLPSGLGRLLPFLLLFLFRKPKILIPILAIGAVWYFFLGGKEMFSAGPTNDEYSDFSFGASFDEARYDQAGVFEPLSYSAGRNQTPRTASLIDDAPPRLHQGRQGSCVGWASSYAARTILEASVTGKSPSDVAFSPSFLYNQIALSNCNGAYMLDAMEALREGGALPFSEFPYDDRTCAERPNSSEQSKARQFRIKGYNRLTLGDDDYRPDIQGIKQHLAQGAPVVIGMQVGGTFMHQMRGQRMWRPTQRDYQLYGYSGHAMCVIGYDDNLEGGAFQIMNSWGESWGERGIAWVRYEDFEFFVKEAYGLYPMGTTKQLDPGKLSVQFGLVANDEQTLIPLKAAGDRIFRTSSPIRVGDKFKIAITNSIECYTYVFGEETDGSSYVLFPYTEKHSPYCGITGTRLFPRDYSMKADDLGNRDRIAVVIAKDEIDFEALNQAINRSAQKGYAAKVRDALRNQEVADVQFQAGEAVAFSCNLNGKNAVGMVIEIDKR